MTKTILIYALLSFMAMLVRAERDKFWGYLNEDESLLPSDWYKFHPKCNGTRQSPINILSRQTVYNASMLNIKLTREMPASSQNKEKWELSNNGNSCNLFFINI